MTDAKKRMRLVRAHMNYITAENNDVDKQIENLVSTNTDLENAVQLLCNISGVKHDSAITIISEIGTGISQFLVPNAYGQILSFRTLQQNIRKTNLKSASPIFF